MALKLSMDLQCTLLLAICHFAMSQVLHELGSYEKADKQLSAAFLVVARMKSSFIEFMCRIGKAQFAFDREDNENAVTYLSETLALGRANNFENFYIWRPEVITRLCIKALENNIEKEYVQSLIRTRELVPDSPPLNLPEWPWQLKIYTLGKFVIVKDGKPLGFAGKTPRKPLALLKTLIASGNNGVTEHTLSDILWPDAEGDAAHNVFSVTLKRLRELIGIESIIIFQEGRVKINPCLCWIDAWEFDQIIVNVDNKHRNQVNKTMPHDLVKLAEIATELYKGPFLEGDIENQQIIQFGWWYSLVAKQFVMFKC